MGCPNKNVEMFHVRPATRYQSKNANRYLDKHAERYQNKNAPMFPGRNVNRNAKISFGAKFVINCPLLYHFEQILLHSFLFELASHCINKKKIKEFFSKKKKKKKKKK